MANEVIDEKSIRYINVGDGQGARPIDAVSIGGKTAQQIGELVDHIDSESTDTEYPSAKCMWTIYGQLENRLKEI